MSADELDALLTDLEHAMNSQRTEERSGESALQSQPPTAVLNQQKTSGQRFASGISDLNSPGIPTRCSDASQPKPTAVAATEPPDAMSAVGNPVRHNMNELDVLLQDLSNAR